jgi:penicillin-binding protein 1A
MQMVRAYAVFANGGYLVQPYFIQKIVDDRGNVLGTAKPPRAGEEGLRAIDRRNAFIMDSMMQDVTRYGTAAAVARLGRRDLAGKTGTTNDFVDAWFCGYQPDLVGVAWVGYDQPKPLGRNQTGGRVALPIWIEYMGKVLKGLAEAPRTAPPGVVAAKLEPDPTGEVKGGSEFFYREFVPKNEPPPSLVPGVLPGRSAQDAVPSGQ